MRVKVRVVFYVQATVGSALRTCSSPTIRAMMIEEVRIICASA